MGFQNALGNSSGIFGPILTGFIVQRAGYDAAFVVTAAIAAVGSIWWAVGVPKIDQIRLD
jgi:ACS family D-galactonate transporter-like MFS transporter